MHSWSLDLVIVLVTAFTSVVLTCCFFAAREDRRLSEMRVKREPETTKEVKKAA
jgi:hypothetical protein